MANIYGSANLPVRIKTTVVTSLDSVVETTETVHLSSAVPAASAVSGWTTTNEPYGGGLIKQTIEKVATAYVGETVPATTYSSQGSTIELPIQQHPSFSSWSADWDKDKGEFKSTSSKAGVTSYVVGSTTVTKTEYSTSTPSDSYASIGTLAVPGGGYSGTGHWLIVGTGRSKVGEGLWAKETQYMYSAKAWDTDIYS